MVEGHNDRLWRLLPHGQARDPIFTKDGFFPSGSVGQKCVLLFFFWGVGWSPGGSRKVFLWGFLLAECTEAEVKAMARSFIIQKFVTISTTRVWCTDTDRLR